MRNSTYSKRKTIVTHPSLSHPPSPFSLLTLPFPIVIDLRLKQDIENLNSYLDVYGCTPYPKIMKKVVESIRQGFNAGLKPKLTDEGTSGTYEMRNL